MRSIGRPIAVLMSIALLGCFPHNAKLRRYSQLAEGASIVAGIGMEYFANSNADCMATLANPTQMNCKSKGATIGDIGLALILVGLGGFVATISTAQDDKANETVIKTADPEKPTVKLPPGVVPPAQQPQPAVGGESGASASAAPAPGSAAAAAAATP